LNKAFVRKERKAREGKATFEAGHFIFGFLAPCASFADHPVSGED